MTDPWTVRGAADANKVNSTEIDSEKSANTIIERFEDDFSPQAGDLQDSGTETKSLPDSQQYLASLERKLNRIKRDPNLIEQLSRKREECLRNLLNNSLNLNSEDDLALDAPVTSGDSAVQEIYRHIQPVQPLNIGETLHIVKFDQLEERNPPEEASPESAKDMGRIMDSQFGEAFLFLTNLAWKSRITLPMLVTAAFMVMDIRLQIEINIQTRQIAGDIDDLDDFSDDSDDSWETIDSDDEEESDDMDLIGHEAGTN